MQQYFPKVFSKILQLLMPIVLLVSGTTTAQLDYSDKLGDENYESLYKVYEDYFPIGVAAYVNLLDEPRLVEHILKNFCTLTAEWGFGQGTINPEEGVWDFTIPDKIADFCRDNNIPLRDIPIMWSVHDTWMAYKDSSRTELASREQLFERMDAYIEVLFERYGDICDEWNIVNEVFHHGRDHQIKEDVNWFRIAGEDYIKEAFRLAHKYRDEKDIFYINETFVENNPAKADNLFEGVARFIKEGVPVDAIGLQGHIDTLSFNANPWTVKKLLQRVRDMGLTVQISELDMKVHTSNFQENYTELPKWIETWQINKYKNLFKVFRDNADIITNVTFWGVDDAHTYCAYNYVKDEWREEWPLLFDKNSMPKQNYYAVCDF